MKSPLLVALLLALGVQYLAYTNSALAQETSAGQTQPADETWGIGKRVVKTQVAQPYAAAAQDLGQPRGDARNVTARNGDYDSLVLISLHTGR